MQVRLELAAKKRAEEAKITALEDERRAAKEAAEREGIGASTRAATEVAPKEATGHQRDASLGILNAQLNGSKTDGTKKAQSAGISISKLKGHDFFFLPAKTLRNLMVVFLFKPSQHHGCLLLNFNTFNTISCLVVL